MADTKIVFDGKGTANAAPVKKKKRKLSEKQRKMYFADIIIAVCLAVSLVVTACVIWEYHRLNTVIPAGVLTALLAVWGGELLIICIRQIFGSDVITKTKKMKYNYTDSEEGTEI